MIFSLISLLAVADLDIARQALRDGLWEVARTHVQTNTSDEAKLIVLESYASENRWDEVKKALSGCAAKGTAFDYYREAAAGNYAKAAELLRKGGSAVGAAEARMIEAELQRKAGNAAAARQLWREVVAMTNASERAFAVASINLGDVTALRKTKSIVRTPAILRMVTLRLGMELLKENGGFDEGSKLIRSVVADSPDVDGGRESYLALATAQTERGMFVEALQTYRDLVEIWPDSNKLVAVAEGTGEVLLKLGRREEALKSLVEAEGLAVDDEQRALAILRQGDALSELGRGDEAMSRYRSVLSRFPATAIAAGLKRIVTLRELEMRGRELYSAYRFEEAKKIFDDVGKNDLSRKSQMEFLSMFCLYGMGNDDKAFSEAKRLMKESSDVSVRASAMLWAAKFRYNRSEWKEAGELFRMYAGIAASSDQAADALLWSVRAAYEDSDYQLTVKLATELVDKHMSAIVTARALIIQGEALVELSRFDEAILVLERAEMSQDLGIADRYRARICKADALFAMGADNQARYELALEAYRVVRLGVDLSPSQMLVVDFKIARTLEKLRRREEAIDQYYSNVLLAYRDGRSHGVHYDDEAKSVFVRAAFRLAEDFEARGRDRQSVSILQLVIASDEQAAVEAKRRIERIMSKGKFL